jgi:hypothetical protein
MKAVALALEKAAVNAKPWRGGGGRCFASVQLIHENLLG